MRLVTYEKDGQRSVGLKRQDGISPAGYARMVDLIRDGRAGLARAVEVADRSGPVEPDRLLAPLVPGKALFCGINYLSHKEENPNAILPSAPFFFSKLPSAVIGPGDPILVPGPETHADYEVELALVIGRSAKRVTRDGALDHVFGYTVVNDVSARDVQFRDNQITIGKNPDTFCPLGPELVTADEIPDLSELRLSTWVNGELKQSESTGAMIFSVPEILEFLTSYITLEPGDLVSTGTPAGVAAFRHPSPWLRPGDEVTVEIDRIGRLTNPVAQGW